MTKPTVDEVMRLADDYALLDHRRESRAALESAIRSLVMRPATAEPYARIDRETGNTIISYPIATERPASDEVEAMCSDLMEAQIALSNCGEHGHAEEVNNVIGRLRSLSVDAIQPASEPLWAGAATLALIERHGGARSAMLSKTQVLPDDVPLYRSAPIQPASEPLPADVLADDRKKQVVSLLAENTELRKALAAFERQPLPADVEAMIADLEEIGTKPPIGSERLRMQKAAAMLRSLDAEVEALKHDLTGYIEANTAYVNELQGLRSLSVDAIQDELVAVHADGTSTWRKRAQPQAEPMGDKLRRLGFPEHPDSVPGLHEGAQPQVEPAIVAELADYLRQAVQENPGQWLTMTAKFMQTEHGSGLIEEVLIRRVPVATQDATPMPEVK